MKLEKLDHKHALTSWLKVILFALLMLAPMFSIATRCLYVIVNKNAKDSYSAKDEKLSLTNSLVGDVLYKFEYYNDTTGQTNNTTSNIPISFVSVEVPTGTTKVRFENTNRMTCLNDSNTSVGYISPADGITFKVDTTTQATFGLQTQPWYKMYAVNYIAQDMDNAFEYSVSKIADSQYYNWTQNTAIYTGVEAMTTGLGISGATIPILLTYWFLLTVIYIVIDIVINLFTYITHFLNKKTN